VYRSGLALVVVACLLLPGLAQAADFNVNAHTVGQAFEYVRVDGDVVPRRRVTQYLGLNGYDLIGDGENELMFKSSMRFDTDLALIDEELDDPEDYAQDRRFNAFHLMYAYVEGKDLWNHLSFKVGRQLLADVMGWYDFDGIWTRARIWRGLYVELYGGVEVKADTFVLNDAAFDPDGTSPVSTDFGVFDKTVYGIGAAIGWIDAVSTQARVTYRRTFWHPTHGVETDRIAAHLQQRLFEQLKVRGGVVFNFFVTDVEYGEAAVEYTFADPDITTALEYMRQRPVFDADSIFNVFDVRPWDDARARFGWQILDDLYLAVRGGVRFYSADDEGERELSSDQMGTGRLSLRWRPGLGIWTSLMHQTEVGQGGRKHYTAVSARTPWYHDLWSLSGRLLHVNFDADYNTKLEGHGFGANLSGAIKLGNFGKFELMLEEAINPFVQHELRAYAFIDLDFWF